MNPLFTEYKELLAKLEEKEKFAREKVSQGYPIFSEWWQIRKQLQHEQEIAEVIEVAPHHRLIRKSCVEDIRFYVQEADELLEVLHTKKLRYNEANVRFLVRIIEEIKNKSRSPETLRDWQAYLDNNDVNEFFHNFYWNCHQIGMDAVLLDLEPNRHAVFRVNNLNQVVYKIYPE